MTSSHPLDSIIHQIRSYKSNFLSYARYFVSGQYGRIICHLKELEKLNGNSVLAMAIRCYIMCIESDGWLLVIFKIREGNIGKMWNGGTVLHQYRLIDMSFILRPFRLIRSVGSSQFRLFSKAKNVIAFDRRYFSVCFFYFLKFLF